RAGYNWLSGPHGSDQRNYSELPMAQDPKAQARSTDSRPRTTAAAGAGARARSDPPASAATFSLTGVRRRANERPDAGAALSDRRSSAGDPEDHHARAAHRSGGFPRAARVVRSPIVRE